MKRAPSAASVVLVIILVCSATLGRAQQPVRSSEVNQCDQPVEQRVGLWVCFDAPASPELLQAMAQESRSLLGAEDTGAPPDMSPPQDGGGSGWCYIHPSAAACFTPSGDRKRM